MTPQIGLPVQVTMAEGTGPSHATIYPAVIMTINDDNTVDLQVSCDRGQDFYLYSVPQSDGVVTQFYSMLSFS